MQKGIASCSLSGNAEAHHGEEKHLNGNVVVIPTDKISPDQVLLESMKHDYDSVVVFGFSKGMGYQIRSSYTANRLELIGMICECLDHFTRQEDDS